MSSKTPRNAPESAAQRHASVFAALGDATRLSIIAQLSLGTSRSIAQLTEGSQLTRQAVTKHLRVLQEAGVVRNLRQGRESRFQLDATPIVAANDYLAEVSRQWDDALLRLKAFVENPKAP